MSRKPILFLTDKIMWKKDDKNGRSIYITWKFFLCSQQCIIRTGLLMQFSWSYELPHSWFVALGFVAKLCTFLVCIVLKKYGHKLFIKRLLVFIFHALTQLHLFTCIIFFFLFIFFFFYGYI